jgi:hypothetical protein
LEAQLV